MKPSQGCPYCGRAFYPKGLPTTIPVGGVLRQTLVNLVASHPEGVQRGEIEEALYGETRPERANLVHMHIWFANQALASRGYHIWCEGGRGSRQSRYYLGELRGAVQQPSV
jgi:hypothetical protein